MEMNRVLLSFILSILLLAQCLQSPVQASTLYEDAGTWVQMVGEGDLGKIDPSLKKARVWIEGQSRYAGGMDYWYQGMVRAAVGYSLSDRATIWAGYTWLPSQAITYPNGDPARKAANDPLAFVSQQDMWPAFRYILPTEYGNFMFRTMWESNWLVGSQIRERPRQMFKYTLPIAFDNKLSLIAWNETFYRVNSTTYGGKAGFDQNRGFLGFGWTFNPNIRTELGYMNQYIDVVSDTPGPKFGTQSRVMHNLGMASVFISF
jgi:Protein of unknown function (DUF2490)